MVEKNTLRGIGACGEKRSGREGKARRGEARYGGRSRGLQVLPLTPRVNKRRLTTHDSLGRLGEGKDGEGGGRGEGREVKEAPLTRDPRRVLGVQIMGVERQGSGRVRECGRTHTYTHRGGSFTSPGGVGRPCHDLPLPPSTTTTNIYLVAANASRANNHIGSAPGDDSSDRARHTTFRCGNRRKGKKAGVQKRGVAVMTRLPRPRLSGLRDRYDNTQPTESPRPPRAVLPGARRDPGLSSPCVLLSGD
ncbi:hypothetical protein E2C01_001337 [Portunus trituberculatus]|uniref:Uncharacterized protein n=1 Tax=Portunus trituberculatus TaxID=210409 RepID=A0A5B7CGF9_PORTR|nr:hypothetical protein [Portunus trituberculatus]